MNTKTIIGFPNHTISDCGIIRNKDGKILSTQITNSGYEIVHLYHNGYRKACTIHRLVAIAFILNPENKPQVNHKDGNKKNNHVSNLEWATEKENSKHSFDAGLMENSKKKAAERMREIGRKYAKINTENLLKKNREISIVVNQLNMDGDLIKRWDSIKQAEKQTKSFGIRRVLRGIAKQSGGFKWVLAA